MGRKRVGNEGAVGSSKRARLGETVANDDEDENVDSMSEDEGPADCSQRPDFIPPSETSEAESGIIEKVTVQNFMCHSNLAVNLGPNVNFIIGRNGSGKSAIMTAIIVGLGGKASTTNRGNSLKGFVKDKCSTAIIRVQLRNRGSDAFKADQYGSSITVERKLSCDGTGSYKIMAESGSLVSTKKDELNHILDQFNIQIDNPVSILNQDTSRNFLCVSNPELKYKFFLKATQLEQMSNDYLTIQERQKIIKITLEKKKETVPEMEREVQQLEEKYRDLEQLKVLEGKIDDLKKEIAWAQVIELEKKLKPVMDNIKSEKQRVPKYDEKLQECEANIMMKEADWTKVKTELESISGESDQLKGRQEHINSEVKKIKNIVRLHQNDLRRIERDLQNTEKERSELQKRIKDITANAMQDIESERLERERSIREMRDALQGIQFQLNATNNHKNQVEKNVSRINEHLYQLRNDISDAKKNIDQYNRKLDTLRDGQADHLKRFGGWVPELLRQLETAVRRGRFHKPPKGPIGARIKLREECWAIPVESCLKGLAFGYCCTDNHDAMVLREMMKNLCPPNKIPQIIVSKFKDYFYDVSSNKPRCQYPTVVDVLEIDDPVIFNCIVDQTSGESIILIKNPEEARDVMFNRPPEKTIMAYAGNGDQIFGGRSAKSYSYTGSGTSYLKGNIKDEIRKVQLKCREETEKWTKLKNEQEEQERGMRELQGELKRSKAKSFKEQDAYNKKRQEISELEQFEEEAVPDVTVLQEDVNNLTQQIDDFLSKNDDKQKELLQAQKDLDEANKESNSHKAKIQEIIGKAEPLTARLNSIEVDLATAKSHRKHYKEKKKEMVEKLAKMEADLKKMKEEAEKANRQASEYCERVQTRRTVKSLESEILQTERRLRAEQQSRGQIEEITKQYFEAKGRLETVHTNMNSLKKFSKRLGEVLKERISAYSQYRKFIALRAKVNFGMMLSQRGYTGKMKFDHKKEQLILHVNVDQTQKTGSNNSKSLSGGERSFSTISFIMALWDAMEAPFRCLDEFDVFMDMVNRRISMQMMMKIAMEQLHRQFILLTPQDMSNVGGGRRVKIFRLQDPERGQTTLRFQPAESQ